MRSSLLLIIVAFNLSMISFKSLACGANEPMRGYQGPCEIKEGRMSPDRRFFYTQAYGSNVIKKWDLESGMVIKELSSFPRGIEEDDLLRQYPRKKGDWFFVLAEARDKNVAMISGRIGKTEAAHILYDFDTNQVLWKSALPMPPTDEELEEFRKRGSSMADNYHKAQVSPDASQFSAENSLFTLESGRSVSLNHRATVMFTPTVDAAFRISMGKFAQLDKANFNNALKRYQGWFTPYGNDYAAGFYPLDEKTMWVFHKHSGRDPRQVMESEQSKVAGLYLLDLTTGEKIRSVLFNKVLDDSEQQLHDYVKLKMKSATQMFSQKLSEVQTPRLFLLPEHKQVSSNVVTNLSLDDKRYVLLYASGRSVIYDLLQQKPITLFYEANYVNYSSGRADDTAQPLRNVKNGLGPSPVQVDQYFRPQQAVWVDSSQTLLVPLNGNYHEYNLNGENLGTRLAGMVILAWLEQRQVIAASPNKSELKKLAVFDLDTGKKVKDLKANILKEPIWLSHSKQYLVARTKNEHLVIDTRNGKKAAKLKADSFRRFAYNGYLSQSSGTYTDFSTMEPVKLAWNSDRKYEYLRFQGNYILTFEKDLGMEVFDIAENRYVTPMPLPLNQYGDLLYLSKSNTILAIDKLGNALFGESGSAGSYKVALERNSKHVSGYTFDLDTFDMSPVMINALPWEDPVVAYREKSRAALFAKREAEEAARVKAQREKEERLARQEAALLAQVQDQIDARPATERIELFYPTSPISAYISDKRRAQALADHMDVWSQPENHSASFGLFKVPFYFIEDMIPYLPEEKANQAKKVLPNVRRSQLAMQKQIEEAEAIERMWSNLRMAISNYKAPSGVPTTLERQRNYYREHNLYKESAYQACKTNSACGLHNELNSR